MRNPATRSRREAIKKSATETLRYWLQRLGLLLLLVVALFSAVNILTLSSSVQVISLGDKQSAQLHDSASYQAAAQKLLADSVWNRNKITINTGHIGQELLKQFPELAAASVTIPLLAHRPVVYLQPAEPALMLVNSGGAYVVGTSGKVLAAGPNLAAFPQNKLVVVTDESGLTLAPSKQALPAGTVGFIHEVVGQLAAKRIQVTGLTLPPAASEVDAQIAGQTYAIKFNLHSTDTARQQAGTYLAAIAQLQEQGVVPPHYIDVRVSGRAYYQ